MIQLEHSKITDIKLTTRTGRDLNDALYEAIQLAHVENSRVELYFNGNTIHIKPESRALLMAKFLKIKKL